MNLKAFAALIFQNSWWCCYLLFLWIFVCCVFLWRLVSVLPVFEWQSFPSMNEYNISLMFKRNCVRCELLLFQLLHILCIIIKSLHYFHALSFAYGNYDSPFFIEIFAFISTFHAATRSSCTLLGPGMLIGSREKMMNKLNPFLQKQKSQCNVIGIKLGEYK